jgi:acyl-coenzyme A synthetase/AMP-(fatty) acid ligase
MNEKSGMFQNLGENQVKEIIKAAKFSIFFIDEDQRVTLKDIGTKEEIKKLRDIIFEKNEEKNSTAMDIIIDAQPEAISSSQADFQRRLLNHASVPFNK